MLNPLRWEKHHTTAEKRGDAASAAESSRRAGERNAVAGNASGCGLRPQPRMLDPGPCDGKLTHTTAEKRGDAASATESPTVRENGALSRERRSGVGQATAPGDQPSAGEARPTEDGTQRPIFFLKFGSFSR